MDFLQPPSPSKEVCDKVPSFPFLFTITVESLNQSIIKATTLNLWQGIVACYDCPAITHLQYADDTLIFSPRLDYLKSIKMALILFHLASGLKVNFHKISLIGIHVDAPWPKKNCQPIALQD